MHLSWYHYLPDSAFLTCFFMVVNLKGYISKLRREVYSDCSFPFHIWRGPKYATKIVWLHCGSSSLGQNWLVFILEQKKPSSFSRFLILIFLLNKNSQFSWVINSFVFFSRCHFDIEAHELRLIAASNRSFHEILHFASSPGFPFFH